jgi:hypothetical protein
MLDVRIFERLGLVPVLSRKYCVINDYYDVIIVIFVEKKRRKLCSIFMKEKKEVRQYL